MSFAAVASDCWLMASKEVSVADFERMEATTLYAQFNGTSSFLTSTVHVIKWVLIKKLSKKIEF